jgi:hypothetical protein
VQIRHQASPWEALIITPLSLIARWDSRYAYLRAATAEQVGLILLDPRHERTIDIVIKRDPGRVASI